MPLFKTISIPHGLLAVWQMTESFGELLSFFTPEELADVRFQNYSYEKRKLEWLTIRVLLKQMIGSGFEILYSEEGKPRLDHPVFHHISISHSRDFAAICVHQNHATGIDIESISRNFSAVKSRYLSDSELNDVADSALLQCIYWCAKEAVFKLVDDVGVDFRKQIRVSSFLPEANVFSVSYISSNLKKTLQLQYQKFNGHCLVWAFDNIVI